MNPANATTLSSPDDLLKIAPLPSRPEKKVKLGIVGLGWVVKNCHLPSIRFLQDQGWDIDISAICDRSPEATEQIRASCPQATVFSDSAAFLQEADIDAVLIALWPPTSAELLSQALDRGWTALVEKPVSHSSETLRKLDSFARSLGRKVQVGYNRRWQPLAIPLRSLLATSPINAVEVQFKRVGRTEPGFYQDTLCHAFDFVRSFCGDLRLKQCHWEPSKETSGIAHSVDLQLTTANGAVIQLHACPGSGQSCETYTFDNADGTGCIQYFASAESRAEVRFQGRHPENVKFDSQGFDSESDADTQFVARGFVHQMAAFVSGIETQELSPFAPGLKDALATTDLFDTIPQRKATIHAG